LTPAPTPARRRAALIAWAGVAFALVILALYSARRSLVEAELNGWLRSHGVRGRVQVAGLGISAATGRLVVGDPASPDLVIPRAEIAYGLAGGLSVRSVTLFQPSLRARLHDGRLSLGAVDPIIEAMRKAPPSGVHAGPTIVAHDATVALATDAGPLTIRGDVTVEKGRLVRLQATSAPARLQARGAAAELGGAQLSAQVRGDRLAVILDAPVLRLAGQGLEARGGRLRVSAEAPYPDHAWRDADVTAHAELAAAQASAGGQAVGSALFTAALAGKASGGPADLAFAGRGAAELRANQGAAAGGKASAIRAAVTAETLRWTRRGGDVLAAEVSGRMLVDRYARGDLTLGAVTVEGRGPLRIDAGGATLRVQGSAAAHGAWTGLGPVAPGEADALTALNRAARSFRVTAPAFTLQTQGGGLALGLPQPARIAADTGGSATLAQAGRGWVVTSAGGGLPQGRAELDRVALAGSAATAHGRVHVVLSVGPVEDGAFDAAGKLRIVGGVASFAGDGCARFDIGRLALGTNDVRRLDGRLCPAGGPLLGPPLLSIGGGWRIMGRGEGLSAEVPFLQARLAEGSGAVDLGSGRAGLFARLTLTQGQGSDLAPQTRFNPVALSGEASLAGDLWRGAVQVRDPAGRRLVDVSLRHESRSGHGGVAIATGPLAFQPGGLQPAALSPIAAPLGSPATGEASFQGRFDWTAQSVSSSGVLDAPQFDFQSPAGKVSGFSGHIVFDNLAPLHAAPGQALRAQEVVTPIGPLRELTAAIALDADALTVVSGQAAFAGGAVRVEDFVLPLAANAAVRGAVDLDGVQLSDLVRSSPFGDRVALAARVSGRVPFAVQGGRLRVTGGALHNVEPGRLSIQRQALSGAQASGGGTPAVPGADTFTDFAYQAMENLAFTKLEASVDSRPNGRLGVLFHIVGKHDPPQHQEIRLSIGDLIGRKFLGKTLPLPSGTGVDLTLDTTLNLDDLLGDYADFRRLHGSAKVQP
jgi:hypothetical protein